MATNIMNRTITFEYVKCYGEECTAEIHVELRQLKDGGEFEFSVSGNVYKGDYADDAHFVTGGQCLDSIECDNPLFLEIRELWKKYHLNGLHAGTRRQEEYLNSIGLTKYAMQYNACCDALEKAGLLMDVHEDDGRTYTFGRSWLTWRLPEDAKKRMTEIIKWGV